MSKHRRGEKLGWLLGWTGSFLWLGLFSGWQMAAGKTFAGLSGSGLFALSLAVIVWLCPWRHPATRYWKLMLPIYGLLICSVGLVLSWLLPTEEIRLKPWEFFWLAPCLVPLFTLGRNTWNQGGEDKR
ncbi:MAG: hypothetical protein AB1921_06965 [Thermodesulfobacteriota bacterium]